MNLITCTDKCEHQVDGYCSLKKIDNVSTTSESKHCPYYKEKSIKS